MPTVTISVDEFWVEKLQISFWKNELFVLSRIRSQTLTKSLDLFSGHFR